MEKTLTFSVCCRTLEGFDTQQFEQLEYDTVEHLKINIHRVFDIPPHRQIIDGWATKPENDQSILQVCTHLGRINYLFLSCSQEEQIPTDSSSNAQENGRDCMEIRAVKSCIRKINTHIIASGTKFNIGKLSKIKNTVLLAPPVNRKFLVLYMHNSREEFSTKFVRYLRDEEIAGILKDYFYIIGWDVENRTYHRALCKALEDANFGQLSALIQAEACSAVIIQNIDGSPNILPFLIGDNVDSSRDSFLLCLQNSRDFLIVDRKLANGLDGSSQRNEMTSEAFQKIMADRLGDRDYDSFAFDQHDLLKKKIGFALFGPPVQETGYDEVQNSQIENLFKPILKHNNLYAEYQDQVELAFIYVVLEPTDKQATISRKKDPNYNPRVDISPIPIFVLRKCRVQKGEACRIFIDHGGRVYSNWQDYLKNNKLPESIMVLPLNGRYRVKNDRVLLEKHETPSCGVLNTVLKVSDISSTVAGVGSGTLMFAGALTSVIAAPVLIGAAAVGATAGIYSITRSAFGLADKITHDENLSIFNSEARGIYINILAGSLGFVGAGANMAVSQLIARGANIGQGVGLAVNAISVANIGISGIGIINSSYDVFDMWINHNQAPSALMILQLASSVLFFGNAVYNFRTVGQMIDETQGRVLEDYHDSLRSNRHRKTFNKLMKETIRQNEGNQVQGRAEVIKTIRNIANKDDVFAALTRNNKLMNRNGIRFSANGGEITLNGQTINMNEFIGMNREHASAFLSNLPTEPHISISDTNSMIDNFSLNNWSIPNVEAFAGFALTLISVFSNDIQRMIMELVERAIELLLTYFRQIVNETFGSSAHQEIMVAVMEYFAGQASTVLQRYSTWRSTGNPHYYEPYFVEVPVDPSERRTWIFSRIVKICHEAGDFINDIKEYLKAWLLNTIYTRQIRDEAIARRNQHSSRNTNSVGCAICGGNHFSQP
ncbi:unnamed protein product [Diabrotica balteata]|uniref:DUF4781 domain-containing protein n=1 Tax=Diabrotica balteata TaxID=107213 RepID=A0A9N9XEN2_DIABA|nr:unnamed protein product [Diabrotica balteata]